MIRLLLVVAFIAFAVAVERLGDGSPGDLGLVALFLVAAFVVSVADLDGLSFDWGGR